MGRCCYCIFVCVVVIVVSVGSLCVFWFLIVMCVCGGSCECGSTHTPEILMHVWCACGLWSAQLTNLTNNTSTVLVLLYSV